MKKGIGHRMKVFMSKRMIACDEATYLISYKYDNRLGFRKWWSLKMHLLSCHFCRKYAHQIGQLQAAVEQYRHSTDHDSRRYHLSKEAYSKMEQAVNSQLDVK